jgi:hypothetical protein
MRKALPLLLLLLSGCFLPERTSKTALSNLEQQNVPPLPPIQQWETVESLALAGSVSSRLAISNLGDIYYAYAETLLAGDPAVQGLPALHVRVKMKNANAFSEITAPAVDPAATTASVLGLQIDGSGNSYLMVLTTQPFLYRYAAGTTTPSQVTLPTSFQASGRAGAGFHADRTSGMLYIAGTHVTQATSVASVALSTDGGATWTLKDASSTNGTVAFGVTTDASGIIYLAGAMPSAAGGGTAWVLYASVDGGATFTQLDSYQPSSQAAGASSRAEYVAIDSAGHFYVAGSDVVDPATLGTATIVRESSDHGHTWTETSRFSARAFSTGTDTELGLMEPVALALGGPGLVALPIQEAKAPSSYLLQRTPVLGGIWTTALSMSTLSDGEPFTQGVEFDSTTGQIYLMTNFFKYAPRTSTLRLTRF